jgi:hypothetical protein
MTIAFSLNALDDGRVQARFTVEGDHGAFTDALILPSQADWGALADADRQAQAQARYDAWYAMVTAPPDGG